MIIKNTVVKALKKKVHVPNRSYVSVFKTDCSNTFMCTFKDSEGDTQTELVSLEN